MKDIILVVSILLAVGLSVVVLRFSEKADKANKNLEEERYSRMVAEETLQKNSVKMANYLALIKEDQNKMSRIQDILNQEKDVNQDLKKQYDQLIEAKSNLESKLQKVLQEKAEAVAALQTQPATSFLTTAPVALSQPAAENAVLKSVPASAKAH